MFEYEPVRQFTPEEQYRDALVEFELALQEYHPFNLVNGFMRVQSKGFFVFKYNREGYTIYYSNLLELAQKGYRRAKLKSDADTAARFLNWRKVYANSLEKINEMFPQSTPHVIVSKI